MNQLSTEDGYTLIQIMVTDYTNGRASKEHYAEIVDSADEAIDQFATSDGALSTSYEPLTN